VSVNVDLIDAFLILVTFILIAGLIWSHGDKLYDFHKRLKQDYPLLFSVIGYNPQYLALRDRWIKHGRIYLVLFFLLVTSILCFNCLDNIKLKINDSHDIGGAKNWARELDDVTRLQ